MFDLFLIRLRQRVSHDTLKIQKNSSILAGQFKFYVEATTTGNGTAHIVFTNT